MRRRYTKDVKGADAVVWGIPFDAAVTNRPGARFGPQAIRRASAILDNDPQYPFSRDLFFGGLLFVVMSARILLGRLRLAPLLARKAKTA